MQGGCQGRHPVAPNPTPCKPLLVLGCTVCTPLALTRGCLLTGVPCRSLYPCNRQCTHGWCSGGGYVLGELVVRETLPPAINRLISRLCAPTSAGVLGRTKVPSCTPPARVAYPTLDTPCPNRWTCHAVVHTKMSTLKWSR